MQLNMIKQMERHARQNKAIISLGQGIPAGAPAAHITHQVIEALGHEPDIHCYSDPLGILPLRETIARSLSAGDMRYDTDEIMVTGGAIEGINAVLLSIVDSQKCEVILPTPTYSAYSRAINLAKGTVVPVALGESQRWQLPIQEIEKAVTEHTTAILLCNPNNPTGSRYSRQTLESLCDLALRHGFYIITDEVYGNMIYDGQGLYTPAATPKFRDIVIRVVSFSKDFNLTGWRIGYVHGSRKNIERITPAHDTLINCAPVVSQYAALAALEVSEKVLAANRHSYHQRLRIMASYLDKLQPWLSYQLPAGGYFVFPRLHLGVSATEFCYDLLYKSNVIAIPGDDFGAGGESHIRLCFGRSEYDIHEGMRRLQEHLHGKYGN